MITPQDISKMDAIILCGGLGTRLREETEFKPKPMVEIGGRPVVWHIMKHYHSFGIKNFILCLGYKGDAIRDYFLNYHFRNSDFAIDFSTGDVETLTNTYREDWRIVLAETGRDTLTGSRIKRALKYVRNDSFMATYGDGVSNIDLRALLDTHSRASKLGTVSAVRPSSRFGELGIQEGMVNTFAEKPQVAEGWINGGFMVLNKNAFDHVDEDSTDISLENGVLEKLAKDDSLAVYQHAGFWQCMDTYREMEMLNNMWNKGQAPWRLW